MKNLTNIIFNFGKFWLAAILFIAMVISTLISVPFIAAGKLSDAWRARHLHGTKKHLADYSS